MEEKQKSSTGLDENVMGLDGPQVEKGGQHVL